MYRTILFYVGKKNIILNEQSFTLGQLTAEILNITPRKFQRMRVVCFHAEDEISRYIQTKDADHWCKANLFLLLLDRQLREYQLFRLIKNQRCVLSETEYRHDPNDVETVHQLYQQSRKLIRKLATESARSFHCLFYRDNGKDYTAYTDSVMDELVSEGTVALIEAIRSDRYAPDAGKFSTYVYPFIKGAMYRWLENNIGAVAVSKHEMQKVRQAQQMYHEDIPINEITQSMKLSEAQLSQLLNYNTHALSLDQLIEDDCSSEEGDQPHCSMEYGVMLKIWLSLLPEVFKKLKKKDKHLLGHLYGVYGYEKKSLDTLALELELTTSGVYKARDAALKHLQKLYRESDLYIWRRAYQIAKAAASKGGPNRSYLSDL